VVARSDQSHRKRIRFPSEEREMRWASLQENENIGRCRRYEWLARLVERAAREADARLRLEYAIQHLTDLRRDSSGTPSQRAA